MRKQYHLLPSKNSFCAWDIDKLIDKSRHLPVLSIRLDEIKELDENYWYQSKDISPTCRSIAEHMRLVEQSDLTFPIILSQNNRVMDGMHRVVKAFLKGEKEIKAVKFVEDPKPDFVDIKEEDLPYDE